MIYFDITKTATVRHRSGLARLSGRLRDELGGAAVACAWNQAEKQATSRDWFVTAELFSEAERPGFGSFLRSQKCGMAAIFADAIPLKHPHITWPQSVARHPGYMKMLASFDRVWAISEASRDELIGYWNWLGLTLTPPVEVLPLGADFDGSPRILQRAEFQSGAVPGFLCVGIIEPRKNQSFLLEVCDDLWRDGLRFNLNIVGRVNPHFGTPIVVRIKELRRKHSGLVYHEAASDAALAQLYASVRATLCPTIAEGCGLPLLESLWRGVPCVCSDLPVLRENADGGGCIPVELNDRAAWRLTLAKILTDESEYTRLSQEAVTRSLPTWSQAGQQLRSALQQ